MCSALAAAGVTDSPTAANEAATVEPATEPRDSRKSKRKSPAEAPAPKAKPCVVIPAREAARRVGLGVSTIRRMEREGDFPIHVELSQWRHGYVEDEVDAWLAARMAKRHTA
jgi:predicted DNA-binding transcriptional regulator AlpA